MSEAGEKYIQDFGKVFEKHVISEARTLAQEVYSESDIQRWTGDDEEEGWQGNDKKTTKCRVRH